MWAIANHNFWDVEFFKPLQMPKIFAGAEACFFLQRHLTDQILMFHLNASSFRTPLGRKGAAFPTNEFSSLFFC